MKLDSVKKMVRSSLTAVVVALAITGCSSEVKKPLTDRDVLMLIFEKTNGVNWKEKAKENWGSELPLEQWEGVKVNAEGRVTELRINNDSIRGAYPEEIGQLTELKKLSLRIVSRDSEQQPFPASIGDLVNLESLSLSSNLRNVEIVFPPVGKLVNLTKIYFSGTGKIPEGFGQLANLKDFEFNDMIGDFPADISKLTSLERIFIRGAEFTGSLPADIGNLKNLTFLLIDKSQFIAKVEPLKGTLPESIWDLENLDRIFIRSVSTDGTLSPKIANLKKATHIEIISCGLTGEIPVEVYTLSQLKSLEIYNNKLTGTIAPEIGNLTALETFWVNGNQLSGTLPVTMGKMIKLKSLQVYDNQFTGAIPVELANCPLDGVFVKFKGNQFSPNIAPALKAHPTFSKWDISK